MGEEVTRSTYKLRQTQAPKGHLSAKHRPTKTEMMQNNSPVCLIDIIIIV
jgi:hypothetical protein